MIDNIIVDRDEQLLYNPVVLYCERLLKVRKDSSIAQNSRDGVWQSENGLATKAHSTPSIKSTP